MKRIKIDSNRRTNLLCKKTLKKRISVNTPIFVSKAILFTFIILSSISINEVVIAASYSITYDDGVVTSMPADVAGSTSGSSVTVSSNKPGSLDRRFAGWCLGTSSSSNITTTDGVDTCSGTTIPAGGALPVSSGNADKYLYAMWTNTVDVTFNLGAGVSSLVVNGTTISSSGTTVSLNTYKGYYMDITYADGYMPLATSATVNSGDATANGPQIFVGTSNSTVTVSGQAKQNVRVTFTWSTGEYTTGVQKVTVNGQTVSSSGGSATVLGGTTYTATVTLNEGYSVDGLEDEIIRAGGLYWKWGGISSPNFTFTTGIDNGSIYVNTLSSCITADTLITLADGNKERVDDLTGEEELLVWDFDTGSYASAPVTFIDSDQESEYSIIHAYFSDNTDVEIISEHGFFDYTLGEFIYINSSNPERYIGHEFVMQDDDSYKTVELVDIKHEKKVTTPYSPTTYKHFNYFTNDMLSMPGGIKGMFNYFDVDKDTMAYDQEKKQADIERYGLLTAEDFEGIIDEVGFEAYNGQYLNVSIGKGLITWDGIKALAARYGHFTAGE